MNLEFDKMINKIAQLDRISTGSKVIGDLLGGGFPYGTITTIFGEPKVGKSWLVAQGGVCPLTHNAAKLVFGNQSAKRFDIFATTVYRLPCPKLVQLFVEMKPSRIW
jgi:predicted ATP-dependent serine protease